MNDSVTKEHASRSKAGLTPGTIRYTGEERTFQPTLNRISYGSSDFAENFYSSISPQEIYPPTRKDIVWYDICGIHDTELLTEVGKGLGIHSLALEDIADTSQRPKFEEYPGFLFICLKMIRRIDDENIYEHISIIAGDGFVASFQEQKGDVFEPVRTRIRNNMGIIRRSDSFYLAYALVDAVVDHYFIVTEKIEKSIDSLEELVLDQQEVDIIHRIYGLRTELVNLKRALLPARDVSSGLRKNSFLNTNALMDNYLIDLNEHVIQVLDIIDSCREHVNSVIELNLALVSTRMNSVMKILTTVSTIFIPLTFLAGVYGMNFVNMPELGMKYSYPVLWGVMILVGGTLALIFKKLKWF